MFIDLILGQEDQQPLQHTKSEDADQEIEQDTAVTFKQEGMR